MEPDFHTRVFSEKIKERTQSCRDSATDMVADIRESHPALSGNF